MPNTVFSCRPSKKERFCKKVKKGFFFLLFLLSCTVLIYNLQIIPALVPLAKAQTTTEVTRHLQSAIRSAAGAASTNFVHLSRNRDGGVVSLETNSAAIADVSAKIVQEVIGTLCEEKQISVDLPLGNLSGGALLTGRGPKIKVPITVSPQISCEIENEFYESGINQTLHRIVAEIEVETFALLPFAVQKIPVETEYCLAETVIVGKVPDAYTKIHRASGDITESDIDDIYDFGANMN